MKDDSSFDNQNFINITPLPLSLYQVIKHPVHDLFTRTSRAFYLTLILIRTLQQPHVTHKCNGQLQEAERAIIHTRQ